MRIARWLELLSGLAAGVVGLAIIAFVLFGPIYQGGMCTGTTGSDGTACTTSTATMAQVNGGIPPLALLYFVTLAVLLLGVVASTFMHYRQGSNAWRWCLWTATGLLILVALAVLDQSILMLPSIFLAVVASLSARNNEPAPAG
ncbi:MAG TPA: hypothetical protein VH590_12840 [Ktedonobacterales bacterium]|jgi:hypothetical protein